MCDDPTSPNKTVETCSEVSWSEPAQAYTSSASSPDAWDQQPISRAKQQPQWDHETVNAVLRALTTSKHWPHAVPCLEFEATDSLLKKINIYIYMYSKEKNTTHGRCISGLLVGPWRLWAIIMAMSIRMAPMAKEIPATSHAMFMRKRSWQGRKCVNHETSWNNQQPRLLQANYYSVSLRDISTDTASHWQFCLNTTTFTRITLTPKIGNPGYHRRWHRRPAVQWPSTQARRVSS